MPRGPVTLEVSPRISRPERMGVVFFADGLDIGRLDEMVAAGELPNIERRFVRGGARVRNAIGAMPSDTYPNSVSLITGVLPGHHGIVGNRWFDRYSLQMAYYITAETFRDSNRHFQNSTIYEILSDQFTVSVQCHTFRGATLSIHDDVSMAIDWTGGGFVNFDRRTGYFVTRVGRAAVAAGRWPVLTTYYFPGVDEIGHRYGRRSPEYREAVLNVDAQVGRVTDALEGAGLLRDTYCVLVSDHGQVDYDSTKYLNVRKRLEKHCGLRVTDRIFPQTDILRNQTRLGAFDAVVMNGSFRRSVIHLRGVGGWHERPSTEAVDRVVRCGADGDRLYEHPAVELAAIPLSHDRVLVISRAGEAEIERVSEGGSKSYRLTNKRGDALGYLNDATLSAFVNAGAHDSRAWLVATANTRIPDFVPQVVEMFESPRAGDIVLFASDAGTFEDSEVCGHGSCLSADVKLTLFFAGPGITGGAEIPHCRMVDVMPTVLDLLGEVRRLDERIPTDGISLREQLMKALPAAAADQTCMEYSTSPL